MNLTADQALDAREATADAAIAREASERREWLANHHRDFLAEFADAHPQLFAAYQEAQWREYVGEAE